MSNLDNLLDQNLDDIADLPEFKPFPAGVHQCVIEFESKEVNEHPAVEMKVTAVSTLELADPTNGVALGAGDQTGILFMLDNEFGAGKLKAVMAPLSAHFGTPSIRATMEAAKGAEVILVTKVRTNKDKTQSYTDVVSLSMI